MVILFVAYPFWKSSAKVRIFSYFNYLFSSCLASTISSAISAAFFLRSEPPLFHAANSFLFNSYIWRKVLLPNTSLLCRSKFWVQSVRRRSNLRNYIVDIGSEMCARCSSFLDTLLFLPYRNRSNDRSPTLIPSAPALIDWSPFWWLFCSWSCSQFVWRWFHLRWQHPAPAYGFLQYWFCTSLLVSFFNSSWSCQLPDHLSNDDTRTRSIDGYRYFFSVLSITILAIPPLDILAFR